jgi:hypothetical protein
MTAVTQWLDGATKPIHKGPYQVKPYGAGGHIFYSFWDGKVWMLTSDSPERAFRETWKSKDCYRPEMLWRGLAEQPK